MQSNAIYFLHLDHVLFDRMFVCLKIMNVLHIAHESSDVDAEPGYIVTTLSLWIRIGIKKNRKVVQPHSSIVVVHHPLVAGDQHFEGHLPIIILTTSRPTTHYFESGRRTPNKEVSSRQSTNHQTIPRIVRSFVITARSSSTMLHNLYEENGGEAESETEES